ncbi:unnamed protein product [Mytilus coruscus]|uniref:Uncharacterized protein n=1 Tax=Mytilus coruscus TaxID=42192 RepID=A0A6J8DL06_MYTCO|nr:unnamed protein product [Mytilus coruscus]
MSTVYTTMKKCMDMSKEVGQDFAIQTFDQQLYAVSQQVKWSMPEVFQSHILRLGGFHTLSCFIACIGKLWSDGGLRDLMADSGVYAGCTVDQMLLGKQFNLSVRGLTLVYEALRSLWFVSFFRWCEENDGIDAIPKDVWVMLSKCQAKFSDESESYKDALNELTIMYITHVLPLTVRFRNWGYLESSTFKYWDMFLNAVEVMLQNIRAERESLWSLHLHTTTDMLPYFFITNRTNYSRWTPVYILDMLDIPHKVQSAFDSGKFAKGTFNGIWSDMATEKTIIKDSKGHGGIVGLTRNKSALIRWTLTRHVLGYFGSEMRDRAGLSIEMK